VGDCGLALVLEGEIAFQGGEADAAHRDWQRAAELLAPRLPGTRDWRLLDPAARAAIRLGRADEAKAILAQLTQLGYVPLDPWPEANRLDATGPSTPKM
jgi:hypothetical protein